MKIFDLTRGKYEGLYNPSGDSLYTERIKEMSSLSDDFQSRCVKPSIDISKPLNNILVFLVESSMANENIAVQGCQYPVRVPINQYSLINENFNVDEWVNSKKEIRSEHNEHPKEDQLERNPEEPREGSAPGISVLDMSGAYVNSSERDNIPRRIFIWLDVIADKAREKTNNQGTITENAQALFDLVLCHEMAHALMDVELYGVHPSPNFSFFQDYPYRFFEEIYADGIAFKILSDNGCTPEKQEFIKDFVNIYVHILCEIDIINKDTIGRWMTIKVLFNQEIAEELGNLLKAWKAAW